MTSLDSVLAGEQSIKKAESYYYVSLVATNGSLYFILAVLLLLLRSSTGLFLVGPMNDLNLQGLGKDVTKMVTGCLRTIKVAIFAV